MQTLKFEEAALLRSVVFVGGCALEALPVALDSAADAVCIDLEDAVPIDLKSERRKAVMACLDELDDSHAPRILIRINSLRTLQGIADIHALLSDTFPVAGLVMPKVETSDEVQWASALADDAASAMRFIPIIETAQGLEHCRNIALGSRRVTALFFGGYDLSTALGCEMAWEPLLHARSRVVHAAASADIQVLDSPYLVVDDLEGLRASAAQARSLGMTGKTAKQLGQVPHINAAFSATAAEIDFARRAVLAYDADPTRPLIVDGKLLELPTVLRLQRIANGRMA